MRNGLSSFGIARVPCGEIEITKEWSGAGDGGGNVGHRVLKEK